MPSTDAAGVANALIEADICGFILVYRYDEPFGLVRADGVPVAGVQKTTDNSELADVPYNP
jgi:hypothetical protein